MYRDRWLKAMNQFSNICGTSPINNQRLFFDGHDSHYDDCDLTQMQNKNIQPFILKAGDSINDQPNDKSAHHSGAPYFYLPKLMGNAHGTSQRSEETYRIDKF